MASVVMREGLDVSYHIPVFIRDAESGYMAYNDELQVAAEGDTEAQAIDHFLGTLRAMVEEFGDDLLEPFKRMRLVNFE